MSGEFQLEVRSPEKIIYSGKVTELHATAKDGALEILAGHAPLATLLSPGQLRFRMITGEENKMETGGGFLMVKGDRVQVLSLN